jgi:serine/threonine-protein kinase haspin
LLSDEPRTIKDFPTYGLSMAKYYYCTKIAEGGFSDVYTFEPKDTIAATQVQNEGGSVLKIVFFNLDPPDGNGDWPYLALVLHEVKVLRRLSEVPGFVHCRGVRIAQGNYPDILSDTFEDFKKIAPLAEAQNPNPAQEPLQDKLYAILEMSNVGKPIEYLDQLTCFQAFDIFWTVTLSLATAEALLEFEHRDLHVGNICYKPRSITESHIDISDDLLDSMTSENKPKSRLGLSNMEITIIDFTLSRMKHEDGSITYSDMTRFENVYVDPSFGTLEDHQFLAYARVRDCAVKMQQQEIAAQQGTANNDNVIARDKYERYNPRSNVVWMAYLAEKIRRSERLWRVDEGEERVAGALEAEMWRALEGVLAVVADDEVGALGSAGEVVALGVEKGWLSVEDVEAFKAT